MDIGDLRIQGNRCQILYTMDFHPNKIILTWRDYERFVLESRMSRSSYTVLIDLIDDNLPLDIVETFAKLEEVT